MIYAAVLIILLVLYITYLHFRLAKVKKNLKELIVENEKQTTESNAADDGDIYFKTDLDFNITYANDATCRATGFSQDELIGKNVLGTLMENNEANAEKLKENLSQIVRNQTNLNVESVISKKDGQKKLMHCRKRPILNEALKCVGISYLCQDVSEAEGLKRKLSAYTDYDTLAPDIYNEATFLKRLEHNFNLAKRYNTPFSLVVVELKDIYEFVSKGIDFDTGDKLLKNAAQLAVKEAGKNAETGRFDKTKLGIILNKVQREDAAKLAQKLYTMIIANIRSLNVDQYNAEMIVVSYTDRKNFNDSEDALLGRVRRHIGNALRTRKYGIKSSDRNAPNKENC